MRRFAPVLRAVVLALVGGACVGAPAAPTAVPAPATTTAPATSVPTSAASNVDQRKAAAQARGMIYLTRAEILAAAEKEGELIVSPGFEETVEPVKKAFTEAYPMIKTFTWRVVTGNAAGERYAAELIAGRSDVDATDMRTDYRADLEKNNVLAKYDLKAMVDDGQLKIPPSSIDQAGWSTWNTQRMWIIAYNPEMVPEAQAPRSWQDCLDPKWSGKFFVDTNANIAGLLPAWGEQRTLEYARNMHQNQPVYVRGNTGGLTRMLAGELPMYCGVQFGSSNRILMKDAKAPLKMVFADPVPVELGENEAVVRTGKHPHAALLWLEFLGSPPGVKIIDQIDPGVAPFQVEGTIANKTTSDYVKNGGKLALCDAACTTEKDKVEAKIAVESWGFPSVGYEPK